ncbi:MAG: TIGR04255 family protein [Actinomycetota bacterium]|nr:TIGR04255 family protein [Actinomycetota bacterium]
MFDFLPAVPAAALQGGPLLQVITQVTFNPQSLLASPAGAVAVHERLSDRYPRYVAEQQALITAGPGGVTTQQVPQWRFTDLAGEQSVILSGESVALETSAYATWSDNLDRLQAVLEGICSVSAPRVRERLGLRYVNQVAPDDSADGPESAFAGRVRPSLLGLIAAPGWQGPLGVYLTQITASEGPVQLGLRYGAGPQVAGENFVIDIDCSVTTPGALDTAEIMSQFTELNDVAWRCFCACIEPAYREMLTP